MKHLKTPPTGNAPTGRTRRQRRTAARFGISAIIASFVVLGMLIAGAMFQEEYEEGFVRIVSFAVRLATPEEVAEAEAQGPIPEPLPVIRPDTPIRTNTQPQVFPDTAPDLDELVPEPRMLIPVEGLAVETPDGLQLLPPEQILADPDDEQEEAPETD